MNDDYETSHFPKSVSFWAVSSCVTSSQFVMYV